MGDISFHSEDVGFPGYDPEILVLWVEHVVKILDRRVGELSYIFCSDEYILGINRQHLSHDYYTDIITFNYNEGNVIAGDVFVSTESVNSNASEYGDGVFEKELQRVMIHGVLHLCGFNDETEQEQKKMTEMEEWALKELERFT